MKKQTATTNSDTRMLELRQELWDTARELRYAYARFNFITDPGLIDAGIYDINALKSRYDFLLRKMKEPACMPAGSMNGGKSCLS